MIGDGQFYALTIHHAAAAWQLLETAIHVQ